METNVNYTVVGAFVVLLVAALVMAIIWLSSGITVQQYSPYLVQMEESVSGLTVDSIVEYNGVEVGKVKSIELNQKNPQQVEVLLNIKEGTPVTKGTVATLVTKGLTGVATMSLKTKTNDREPLVALPGEPYPIIPTAPSFFLRLDTAISRLSENIQQLSQSMQNLLTKENLQSFNDILKNIKVVSHTLAENSEKINILLTNATNVTKEFTPLLQSSNKAMQIIQTQTLPTTYRLLSHLEEVVQTISDVSTQIKQNPSILIQGTKAPPLGPGETR